MLEGIGHYYKDHAVVSYEHPHTLFSNSLTASSKSAGLILYILSSFNVKTDKMESRIASTLKQRV